MKFNFYYCITISFPEGTFESELIASLLLLALFDDWSFLFYKRVLKLFWVPPTLIFYPFGGLAPARPMLFKGLLLFGLPFDLELFSKFPKLWLFEFEFGLWNLLDWLPPKFCAAWFEFAWVLIWLPPWLSYILLPIFGIFLWGLPLRLASCA